MFVNLRKVAWRWALTVCFVTVTPSIVRSETISGGMGSFSENLPFSDTLTGFTQYNGALPLVAIEFLFDINSLSGTASITSGPGNPTQTVALNFASLLSVSNPSDTTVLVSASPTASTTVTIPGDGTAVTESVSGTSLMASALLTNPALFAPFEGTGMYSLPITGNITVGFTPHLIPPFSVSGATGTVSGTLEVLYVQLPEPSAGGTVLLGGLVVAAASLLRRPNGHHGRPAFS